MAHILIADDNQKLIMILSKAAQQEGHTVCTASDGAEAMKAFERENPDLILLDVMMPKMDGFQVCRRIREKSSIPIIMITARGEDFEKIMGLDTGADDYIVKPFSPGEVMARVRAVLRRIEKQDEQDEDNLTLGNMTVSLDSCFAKINDTVIPLTKKETDILYTLMRGKNHAFTRNTLLDMVWGYDYYGDPRTVDSHIKRLRAKLDKAEHPQWEIKTVRGVGYKFEVINA